MDNSQIQSYWQDFIKQHQIDANAKVDAYSFGAGKVMEDELANLVANGFKTATTSAAELYEPDEEIPQVGDYNIILDGSGQPVCVTQTKVVETVPFKQVMVEHAYHEGEGDRSYEYWHQAHVEFFTDEYREVNRTFNESVPVICEVFELVGK
ncbi:ASCH domain-containing protein [Pediococcus argentinicus]|uniref:ASCH domain protein n=1 Tax=Pediococcus argentinicus TaxID=480391 RepID=A0A0R2NK57_9LACO|nr:ASCH domain-containing protein [Pediococcus argentinicus]KRO26136.1 ASCH domain protein [Pediococcus argentinicus]NKZ21658.1 ASCH domain-containing protein [Pediococcus argentinicus]GEP18755.1 RNA-binding protein [Pediococcus argentinicus]